jgi:hypothetical protein
MLNYIALQHFEPVHVSLYRTVAPRCRHRRFHGMETCVALYLNSGIGFNKLNSLYENSGLPLATRPSIVLNSGRRVGIRRTLVSAW